jgi:hypothetical protein
LGLTNIDGTKVVPVGGKNAVQWSISQGTSYKFTPSTVQTTFTLNQSVFTNVNGQYSFGSTGLDINNYQFQIVVPEPNTSSSYSEDDAKHVIDLVLGKKSISSREFYRMDVNDDGKFTVSDGYLIFGKVSGSKSSLSFSPSVRLFNSTEWTTIKNSSTNLKSSLPGLQTITITNPQRGGTTNFYILTNGFSNQNKLTY